MWSDEVDVDVFVFRHLCKLNKWNCNRYGSREAWCCQVLSGCKVRCQIWFGVLGGDALSQSSLWDRGNIKAGLLLSIRFWVFGSLGLWDLGVFFCRCVAKDLIGGLRHGKWGLACAGALFAGASEIDLSQS